MSERRDELITGYVLNTLSPQEIKEFEQMVRDSPELNREVDKFREVMGLIAYTPPQTKAPENLRAKIFAITEEKSHPMSAKSHSLGRQWQLILIAVLALLALFLGIKNYILQQQVALLETITNGLQGQETYLFALKGTKQANNAYGNIVLNLDTGSAVVAVQNLPPLSSGEAYHVWAFDENQKRIFCGRFNTDNSGRIFTQFLVNKKEYTSDIKFMRISRESSVNPPNPNNQRVMVMTSETNS